MPASSSAPLVFLWAEEMYQLYSYDSLSLKQGRPRPALSVEFLYIGLGTRTIHITPKRSVTMPKAGEKNVWLRGAPTCPPSESAANRFFASTSVGTINETANPWKLAFPLQRPSDIITIVGPIL